MTRILSLFVVFMLGGVLAFSQSRTVTGIITDKEGSPVPFATIKVKGSSNATPANDKGVYSINAKDGDILEISSSNFETQKFVIKNGNSSVNIQLRPNVELTGVVVTALGIKRQAKELGYATTKINANELNQAKVTNIATGLAAKVSGLQINLVNNSVKPDVRITLRGNRSILGNNQALLVVDDVQLPISYIGSLNPNDVDNVTVLKGASASALYGSDASNGVIVVTTKKGSNNGKPVITLSSTVNFESVSYLPELQNEFGGWGGESGTFPGVVFLPSNPYVPYVPYENQSYGPRFNGQKVPIGAPIRITNPDGTYYIAQDSGLYSAKPNAKAGFFNKGTTFTNDFSYAVGDEKSKFFFSFQDVNTKGITPKDVSRRNSIRANGYRDMGKFRVDYNIGYSLTHTNTTPGSNVPFNYGNSGLAGNYGGTPQTGGSYFQARPIYFTIINQAPNIDLRDYQDWKTNPYASPDGFFNAYYGNPWWQIDQTRLDERENSLISNFILTYKPSSWFNVQYKAGISRTDYVNKYTRAGYVFAPWAIADTLASGNIPSSVKSLSPQEGDALSSNQRLNSDLLFSFHKEHNDFDYNLVLGSQVIVNKVKILNNSANVLVIPDFYNISNRVGEPNVTQSDRENRKFGVFADFRVGYKKWLFLHGSLRNDWTSLLSENNRSYLYPAVDMAFVFTDALKGLQENKTLSFGKVRLAYSKTAQVSIGEYSLQNIFNAGNGFPFGGVAGFTVGGRYNNPNIKPEFSTDKEAGLELGFLKNRILLTAAYYTTLTDNQTIPISISPATGYSSAFVNTGVMKNEGYEIDLKVSPLMQSKSGWRWDIGANYSYNKNTVVSLGYNLPDVLVGGDSYAIVGQPYPSLKLDDWNRDPAGHIIVDKATGYPSLNQNKVVSGTTNPPIKIGLNTSVSFKGFTITAVADGRFGAVILNQQGSSIDFTGLSKFSTQSGRQPFVIPNSVYDDGSGKYVTNTNINTQDGNGSFWANTLPNAQTTYLNSADFWKLRELSLAYNFPKSVIGKSFKAVSVQITARNLITLKAKENVWSDPEFSNTNGNATGTTDINQLPPTKFISFSLNLTF